jgi:hypothetical protein
MIFTDPDPAKKFRLRPDPDPQYLLRFILPIVASYSECMCQVFFSSGTVSFSVFFKFMNKNRCQ